MSIFQAIFAYNSQFLALFRKNTAVSFQERLKIARGKVSQKQFAEFLGVHNSTFSRWERGEQVPNQTDLLSILKHCPDINPTWLITGEGPMDRGMDHFHQRASTPVDMELLEAVIAAVEDHLTAIGGWLPPEKKAQLIATLYDLSSDNEEKKVDRATVISLVKLAA